jgi:hypothetical protein
MMIELVKVVETIDITNMTKEELQEILDRASENNLVIHVKEC